MPTLHEEQIRLSVFLKMAHHTETWYIKYNIELNKIYNFYFKHFQSPEYLMKYKGKRVLIQCM